LRSIGVKENVKCSLFVVDLAKPFMSEIEVNVYEYS